MVLFHLHEFSQYTINVAWFNKLVHVLWVLISHFKDFMTVVVITYCECKK